ncbi:MAG: response regulator [Alphaproteobacteria bacterium]
MSRNATYNFAGMSALVMEHSSFLLSAVSLICRSVGIRPVHEATSAGEALALLRDTMPDFVITTCGADGRDGLALCTAIRGDDALPCRFVPIVMMTSHSVKHVVELARDAGVTEVLAKPISAAALLDRIVYVVDHPRPFVQAPDYFGPDRRRRPADAPYNGPERRLNAPVIVSAPVGVAGRVEAAAPPHGIA